MGFFAEHWELREDGLLCLHVRNGKQKFGARIALARVQFFDDKPRSGRQQSWAALSGTLVDATTILKIAEASLETPYIALTIDTCMILRPRQPDIWVVVLNSVEMCSENTCNYLELPGPSSPDAPWRYCAAWR